MKTLKSLLLFILCIFLTNCTDDNDNLRFDKESLEQTTWEGTDIVTDEEEVISTERIIMQFFTKEDGQYTMRTEGSEADIYKFNYSIEGKMMDIDGGPLSSKWTLLEMTKDKMVLEMFYSYKVTLTLYKKY